MKAFTLIVSTVAAVSMGAIGFTYAQSNTDASNPNPQTLNPTSPGTTGNTGTTGTTGATTGTGTTGTTPTTTTTTGTTGATSTDNMYNERMARADRN